MGLLYSSISIVLVIWLPAMGIFSFMSVLLAAVVLYSIKKHWGFQRAMQIVTSSSRVDFGSVISSTENVLTDVVHPFLSKCSQIVGPNPQILHKNVHLSKNNLVVTMGAVVLPIQLGVTGFVLTFIIEDPTSIFGKIIMLAASIAVWFLVYLFVGHATHVTIITKTHWISFVIGLTIVPMQHCIPIEHITKIEHVLVNVFGGNTGSISLSVEGLSRNVFGGYVESETLKSLLETIEFKKVEPSFQCCTIPPRHFLIINAIAYAIIVVVFIVGTRLGFLFLLICSISPVFWMLTSFVLAAIFVQVTNTYKNMANIL